MNRSRIRDRVAFAATTALLLVSACGGGTEPVSVTIAPAREPPPPTRDAPGSSRDNPGATREPPGAGRENPPGTGSTGSGSGGTCPVCATYACQYEDQGKTVKVGLALTQTGSECSSADDQLTLVFHCGGTITASDDTTPASASWAATGDGGLVIRNPRFTAVCTRVDIATGPEQIAAGAR